MPKYASDSEVQIRWVAHAREHLLEQAAREKAEHAMDRRLGAMNDYRSQIDRQAVTFITRDAWDAQAEKYDAVFRAQAAKHDTDVDSLREQIQAEREIRKSFEASVSTWRWIASFLGASGVGGVILLFVTRAPQA